MAERESGTAVKERLYTKLMETLSEHGAYVSVSETLSILRRMENELSVIALSTTVTKTAAAHYTVDAHGKVVAKERKMPPAATDGERAQIAGEALVFADMDEKHLIVTAVGSNEHLVFTKQKALAFAQAIIAQSQSLSEP